MPETHPTTEGNTLRAGDRIAGRYELEQELGRGAMGAVWRARDLRDAEARPLAIKALAPLTGAHSDAHEARFYREAKAGARIQSPHVVPVSDYGVDPATRRPYLAMGLMKGRDLGAVIEAEGPLRPTVAVRVACQACWGVIAAHRAGVIHRDLKPTNVFLHEDEQGNVIVKVCDFGVAKAADDEAQLTHTGHILGTPLFMAPEQVLRSRHVTEAADVWGLAVTLYTALCGRAPLQHMRDLTSLLLALNSEELPRLQDLAPWVPGPLAAIVHGGLIHDPKQRCPSARALLEALEPRAGGTLTLRAAMLRGVSEGQQRQRVAVVAQPRTWEEVVEQQLQAAPVEEVERDPLLGVQVGERFELTRLLGRGGMGAVYEARAGGSRYAVKVVLDELGRSPLLAQRFVREARAVQAIDSPHVVAVIEADAGPDQKRPYIVMEMMEGDDLDRLLKTQGALAPASAARLFTQACRGVEAAHRLGIVHRDIKPANIFLHEPGDGHAVVKVCDFGVAKSLLDAEGEEGADLTRTGGLLGSPMYMSPEQARSARTVDHRTDIWSMGASLYEALTGARVWGDSLSVGELIISICTDEPRPLGELAPWVDPKLAAVVMRALRREPQERFSSMGAMIEALRPFTEGREQLTLSELSAAASPQRAVSVGADTLNPHDSAITGERRGAAPPGLVTADATVPDSDARREAPRPSTTMTLGRETTRPQGGSVWLIIGLVVGALIVFGAGLFMILGGS